MDDDAKADEDADKKGALLDEMSIVDGSDAICYALNIARLLYSPRVGNLLGRQAELFKTLDDFTSKLAMKVDIEYKMLESQSNSCAEVKPNKPSIVTDGFQPMTMGGDMAGGAFGCAPTEEGLRKHRIDQVTFLLEMVREQKTQQMSDVARPTKSP